MKKLFGIGLASIIGIANAEMPIGQFACENGQVYYVNGDKDEVKFSSTEFNDYKLNMYVIGDESIDEYFYAGRSDELIHEKGDIVSVITNIEGPNTIIREIDMQNKQLEINVQSDSTFELLQEFLTDYHRTAKQCYSKDKVRFSQYDENRIK